MASIASAGNHALRARLAGKYVPEHLKDNIRRFHQEYDYAQHGVKTGKNETAITSKEKNTDGATSINASSRI